MSKVNITENLGVLLKNLRTQYNIKAVDVSKLLGKTGAYITKLEKAEIKTIDFEDLIKILKFITGNKENFDKAIEKLISEINLQYTDEEIKKEEWTLNVDTVARILPITEDLSKYISDKITELKITPLELSKYINSNFELCDDIDIENSPKNLWVFNNGHPYIVMDVSEKEIEDIISGLKTSSNYVTIQAIILSLNKIAKYELNEAYSITKKTLNDFGFYTLSEKYKRMKNINEKNKLNNLLANKDNEDLNSFDRLNISLLASVVEHISAFSHIDVEYTNSKLKTMVNNFNSDAPLEIAMLGIDIQKLKTIDIKLKREFIEEINNLIDSYSTKVLKENKVDLI